MARALNPGPSVTHVDGRPVAAGGVVDVESVEGTPLVLLEQPDATPSDPPPLSGKGSGSKEWADYARSWGHSDAAEMPREDLIDELHRRGVDVGRHPDPTPDPDVTPDLEGDL